MKCALLLLAAAGVAHASNHTNVTQAPWTPTPAPTTPAPRAIPGPGPAPRTSERSVSFGLRLPEGVTIEEAEVQLYNAVEDHILGDAKGTIDTVVTTLVVPAPANRRDGKTLETVLSVLIQFVDTLTGLSDEEKLKRKCELDKYVRELAKQSADPESALRKAFPYLTGEQSVTGDVSKQCEEDDDLSGGAIAGIVIGVLVFIGIIGAVAFFVVSGGSKAKPADTEPIAA